MSSCDYLVAVHCRSDETDPSLYSSFDSDSNYSDHHDPSDNEASEFETSEANEFNLNESQDKEETYETSESKSHNFHSNLEFTVKASGIECFDPNSSNRHGPSVCEFKELDEEAPDSSSQE